MRCGPPKTTRAPSRQHAEGDANCCIAARSGWQLESRRPYSRRTERRTRKAGRVLQIGGVAMIRRVRTTQPGDSPKGRSRSSATKTPGTSPDNPRPFPHVLPLAKMKPGNVLGWECQQCGNPIAVDPEAPATDRQRGDRFVKVECPHCGAPNVRMWAGLRDIRYRGKSAS